MREGTSLFIICFNLLCIFRTGSFLAEGQPPERGGGGLSGCPGTAFPILGQNADPGGAWVGLWPAGPRKIFETFFMGVGKNFGLGGSKYQPKKEA